MCSLTPMPPPTFSSLVLQTRLQDDIIVIDDVIMHSSYKWRNAGQGPGNKANLVCTCVMCGSGNEPIHFYDWKHAPAVLLFHIPTSLLIFSLMMSTKTLPSLVPHPIEGSNKSAFTGCWSLSLLSKLHNKSVWEQDQFESPRINVFLHSGLWKTTLAITSVHWIEQWICCMKMDSSEYISLQWNRSLNNQPCTIFFITTAKNTHGGLV